MVTVSLHLENKNRSKTIVFRATNQPTGPGFARCGGTIGCPLVQAAADRHRLPTAAPPGNGRLPASNPRQRVEMLRGFEIHQPAPAGQNRDGAAHGACYTKRTVKARPERGSHLRRVFRIPPVGLGIVRIPLDISTLAATEVEA